MSTDEKLDQLIMMFGNLDEKVSRLDENVAGLDEKVSQLDEKVNRLDEKVNHLDEKVNQLDRKVNHLDKKVDRLDGKMTQLDERTTKLESEFSAFREDTEKNFDLLRVQIGAVADALNTSNRMNEARFEAIEQEIVRWQSDKDELERVQNQHSIDIMKLRAAI